MLPRAGSTEGVEPALGFFTIFAPMVKKQNYKQLAYWKANQDFLLEVQKDTAVQELSHGIFYRVLTQGSGQGEVKPRSVVTVHYRGTLIDGREFDNSWKDACPAAFRVNTLINGFQLALLRMKIGDKWVVYIPSEQGYGDRAMGNIPGGSTLIFEIELISIA